MPSIGRYEIEREIGRGAMGVVYLARDPHLQRQVAVKTYSLPDGISEEMAQEFHERFLREARAAASLSHPGIVTIHDAGEDPVRKIPYIAMEFIQGQSLKQRLAKGDRMNPAWVISFGAVLADALHLAHRAGIVHRDIKPANILIRDGDGAVKLADFGVARLKESDLTQTGAAVGSPGYMSPEQIKGSALDGRSDLFSLAVVLYEALCGKRPFHGDDLISLAYSIAHDTQVPLARQLQACPAGLDRFFDKALSKDPGRRFPDGAAFKKMLLDAGGQIALTRGDRTVADTNAVAPMVDPNGTVAAGLETRHASSSPASGHGRRGRFVAIAAGAAALLLAGLAAAAYLKVGVPSMLKADARAPRVSQSAAAAGVNRPAPPSEDATAYHEAGPREQAPSRQQVIPGKSGAPVEVEPAPHPVRIPRNPRVTIPAGTEIHVALDAPVGSSSSRAGDEFTARITEPVITGDRVAIPVGSRVHGRVSEAIPAKKGLGDKAGSLSLTFDGVVSPSGFGASMSAVMTRVGSGSGKKTAAIIGGSAAGGALLGKVLGKKTKDTAVGSIVGGAIGAGVAAGTKGEDVELPAGSALSVSLQNPLTITVNP